MSDDIAQPPPPEVAAELSQVSSALDRVVPVKQPDRNLLIGTWNVRAFERMSPKCSPNPRCPRWKRREAGRRRGEEWNQR